MNELKDCIIKYYEKYYMVRDINVKGILKAHLMQDKSFNTSIDVDPLTVEVYKLPIYCKTRLIINGSSLESFTHLVQKDIKLCAAYKNKYEEYLLILEYTDESYAVYKLSNGGKDVYVSEIRDGVVVEPLDKIYSEVRELSGFNMGFSCKMYKLSKEIFGSACYNMLVGLLATANYGDSVDLSFLSHIDKNLKYYLVYLKEKGQDVIIPVESLDTHLKEIASEKITREEIENCVKESYDYPATYFSKNEELEKAEGILKRYGYSEVSSLLRRYNGKVSNYNFSSCEDSIAIFDVVNTNSYYIRHLSIKPIYAYNHQILYYDLRSYALGDTVEYSVLASSINKNYLQDLIRSQLADMIRSSRVHYSGSDYYLNEFKDSLEKVIISCFSPESPDAVYKGVYDKRRKVWSYPIDTPKLARDFMSCLTGYFNKKHHILAFNEG